MFGSVDRAWNMGAAGVGATIYFGSEQSRRQIVEVAQAFEQAHARGMFTVLWCYLRNSAFKTKDVDYHVAADLTGQANHLGRDDPGRHHQAEAAGEQRRLQRARPGLREDHTPRSTTSSRTDNPIDLTRYQVINCYLGRAGLINSGGASSGQSDLAEAVRTAVINKRAGGMGLISGRKAFQRPMDEGIGAAARHPGRVPGRRDHGYGR